MKPVTAANGGAASLASHINGNGGAAQNSNIGFAVKSAQNHMSGPSRARQIVAAAAAATAQTSTSQSRGPLHRTANNGGGGPSQRGHSVPFALHNQRQQPALTGNAPNGRARAGNANNGGNNQNKQAQAKKQAAGENLPRTGVEYPIMKLTT